MVSWVVWKVGGCGGVRDVSGALVIVDELLMLDW